MVPDSSLIHDESVLGKPATPEVSPHTGISNKKFQRFSAKNKLKADTRGYYNQNGSELKKLFSPDSIADCLDMRQLVFAPASKRHNTFSSRLLTKQTIRIINFSESERTKSFHLKNTTNGN